MYPCLVQPMSSANEEEEEAVVDVDSKGYWSHLVALINDVIWYVILWMVIRNRMYEIGDWGKKKRKKNRYISFIEYTRILKDCLCEILK